MARVKIVKRSQLSNEQRTHIARWLNNPVYKYDAGAYEAWVKYSSSNNLYAVVRKEDNVPVGLAYAELRDPTSPGWWIGHKHRNQRYGYALVEALAEYLIQYGVNEIGVIPIRGNCQDTSRKLEKRLRNKFSELLDEAAEWSNRG